MKQREKCSGRGFDSRLVHQREHCERSWMAHNVLVKVIVAGIAGSVLPNGPVMVSTGQRVTEWTAG